MYSDFFRLKEPPFSITPDPRYLYLSKRHQEALAHLLYGTGEEGGFVELTGEVGTGKTTLIRALLQSRLERVDVALILNPRLTVSEFVASICDELGVTRPQRTYTLKPLVDALNQHLLRSHGRGRQTVLIVDEAQNLSLDVLEQVRLLTNLETSRHKLLRIILVGQPELKHLLDRHDMRQLAQRITARFHLEPLSRAETGNYVAHRLEVAGGQADLISPQAIKQVHRYARGIPRLINVICDRALLGAYATGQRLVDRRLVARAAKEALGNQTASSRRLTLYRGLAAAATTAGLVGISAGAYWLWAERAEVKDSHLASEFFGAEFSPVLEDDPAAVATVSEPADEPPPVEVEVTDTTPPKGTLAAAVPAAMPLLGEPHDTEPEPPLPELEASDTPPSIPPLDADTADGPGDAPIHVSLLRTLDRAAAVSHEDDPDGLSARLSALERNEHQAFRQMFELWGASFDLGDDGSPCPNIVSNVLRCFNGPTGWAELRGWNRPAVLRLYDRVGQAREVLLRALDRTHATLQLDGAEPIRFPLGEVDALWAGQASVLWKLQTSVGLFAAGARGEPVLWLRKHLSLLDGGASSPAVDPEFYDTELVARVKRFQADRGLTADGIVGQRTMLYLNNLDPLPGTPMLRLGDGQGAG